MFTQPFHHFFARHFATLYFIFVADSAESELGVLDLIQASTNSFVTFVYFSARREDYIMQCLNQSVINKLLTCHGTKCAVKVAISDRRPATHRGLAI